MRDQVIQHVTKEEGKKPYTRDLNDSTDAAACWSVAAAVWIVPGYMKAVKH